MVTARTVTGHVDQRLEVQDFTIRARRFAFSLSRAEVTRDRTFKTASRLSASGRLDAAMG